MLGPKQRKLIEEFARDLAASRTIAEEWWRDLLDREEQAAGNLTAALKRVKSRWPAGPVTHPRVIAVVRQYYFAAESLNREIGAGEKATPEILALGEPQAEGPIDEEVSPSTLLTEGLMTEKWQDLSEFLSELPYWPVGMDSRGGLV